MNITKRTMLSIRYYWKRTIVVLLIFTCIFIAFFVIFLTWNSSKNQIDCLQKYLGNTITITKGLQDSKEIPSLFTERDMEALKGVGLVKGLNIITSEEFCLKNIHPYIEDKKAYEAYQKKNKASLAALGIANSQTDCRIFAMTDSLMMPFFTGSGFELTAGRAIKKADSKQKVALISEKLADVNHLDIGDSITVSLDAFRIGMGMNSANVSLKIIGFFKSQSLQQRAEKADEYPANFIFVPESLLKEYRMSPVIVYAYAENSRQIPDVIKQLKSVLLDGSNDINGVAAVYQYKWDKDWVSSVSRPLEEVKRVSLTILFILGFVVIALVALIGALLLYKRRYEYYIYRSRGESRRRIFLQSLAEYLVIIFFSSLLALGISVSIEHQVSDWIMKPYVKLYDTYLQELKDKEELVGEYAFAIDGLRTNSASIRNLNQNIPLRVNPTDGLFLICILFILLPAILAFEILISLRENSIRLDASTERS